MGWEVKTDIRGQSRRGLLGSNGKQENIYLVTDRSKFLVLFLGLKDIILDEIGHPSSCVPLLVNKGEGVSTDHKSSKRIKLS